MLISLIRILLLSKDNLLLIELFNLSYLINSLRYRKY